MTRIPTIVALGAAGLLVSAGCTAPTVRTAGVEAVGLRKTCDIRSVYQIKTDEWKEGVGAGLHYVQKLLDTYNDLGVPDAAADVHAVFHGEAGYWLLKDGPYAKAAEGGGPNPNKAVVEALLARGVGIELCAQTMKSHGWDAADVLPGVTIVAGAYPRLIDLQHRGYAYIRF